MRRNRFLAWVLAAALVFSVTAVPASAAYPDVTAERWPWAINEIDEMTQLGMFEGYGNGYFGPADPLSAVQTLILAARVCAERELRQQIGLDRRAEVSALLGENYSWFWDEAATCLEAGIISYDELRVLYQTRRLDDPIPLEEFCVYMVRAMQLGPMAKRLTSYSLGFNDAADVSEVCRPYVYVLSIYSIVQGDDNKNLNPKIPINRAQTAVILSRMLGVMERQGTSVELPEYTSYDWTAGTISNVTAGDQGVILLSLENEKAETKVISCLPSIRLYKENMLTGTESLKPGVYARVCYDEKGEPESVRLSGGLETVSGGISSLDGETVAVSAGGVLRTFVIDRFTQVQVGSDLGDRALIDLEAGYTTAVCKVDDQGDLVYLELQGGTRLETGLIGGVESLTGGGYKLTVTGFDGMSQQFSVPAAAVITANGVTASAINGSYVGSYVSMRVSNQSGEAVSVVIDTRTRYVQGAIRDTTATKDRRTITINTLDNTTSGTYNVAADAVFTYNGEAVAFKDIQRDWFATVRISGGEVVMLAAYPGSSITEGTVAKALEFNGGNVTLSVLQANGVTAAFTMELSKLPTIKRGGANSTIDKIKSGDSVTVTVRYNQVSQIDTVPQEANVSGTIQRKVEELNGTTLELLLDDGSTRSFLIGSGVSVTQNGKAVALSSLTAGSKVSLVVNDGVVHSIEVEKVGSTATELNGTALYINTTDRTILFQLTDGSTVTVSVPYNISVIDFSTGTTLQLRNLVNGDTLQISGSYEGLNFKAALILRK